MVSALAGVTKQNAVRAAEAISIPYARFDIAGVLIRCIALYGRPTDHPAPVTSNESPLTDFIFGERNPCFFIARKKMFNARSLAAPV
jgi:hypothetical protein